MIHMRYHISAQTAPVMNLQKPVLPTINLTHISLTHK